MIAHINLPVVLDAEPGQRVMHLFIVRAHEVDIAGIEANAAHS
jgi:hypothetical protein